MSQSHASATPDLDKLTYINVGAEGRLNGKLRTSAADIDRILARLQASDVSKVVVHFHGGLVNEEAGELTARRVVPLYQSAGAHPVVFIWETGLLETVTHNLSDIHNTKLFKKLLAFAVQQLAKRLNIPEFTKGPGQREDVNEVEARLFAPGGMQSYDTPPVNGQARGGADGLSAEDVEVIQREAQAEIEEQLQEELAQNEALSSVLGREVSETPLLDKSKVAENETRASKGIVTIGKLAYHISLVVYRSAKRFINHRDHGFTATVVEEALREFYLADFGAWAWSGMKDTAGKMWSSNDGLSNDQLHGGRYFLEGLYRVQQQKPSLSIDLVGHSAGSIAICHMFETAASANLRLKIRNLILMAPACTSELFHQEIVLHPERFKQFRMFTMDDAFEQSNHLLSVIYNRSLLYLISGILEPEEVDAHIAGMLRFDTGVKPFDSSMLIAVRKFLLPPGGPQTTVLARSMVNDPGAKPGFVSNAARHQDFNLDADTCDSLVVMLKT
jgi:Alpha/beta hydrolase of unknown function (DUF900)